jgi:paraquat-inducible protein B
MDVGQAALRARYEYGADNESYTDLYEEVVLKIQGRLDELASELDREHSNLVRVQYLQQLSDEQRRDLPTLQQTHASLSQSLEHLRTTLTVALVQDKETALSRYSQEMRTLNEHLDGLRKAIGKLLTVDHDRSSEEEQFMALLEGRQDYDLTHLFLNLHRQQETDLEKTLELLRQLFKKGQLEIKVRRRAG